VRWFALVWRFVFGILSTPARWIEKRWPPRRQPYRYEQVEEFPDSLKAHRLYVAGEMGYLWAAAMLCPCGCGDVIELNLLKKARPCWSVHNHSDGSVSLMPSIWRREGCRSHFFLRHGQIEWCRDYAERSSSGGHEWDA
jgi:hypothetical protein